MPSVLRAMAPATRAELEALPEHLVGEIIEGVLYTSPRPRAVHSNIESLLVGDLNGPFQRGHGGPGGWWILVEPGVELPGAAEIVPDLAGWQRRRLPELPTEAPIRVVPDWVCEILSPSTRRHDQVVKRPFYARSGVSFLWEIDTETRTLTTAKLVDGHWLELGVYTEADTIRAEPFADVALSMQDWWPARAATAPAASEGSE